MTDHNPDANVTMAPTLEREDMILGNHGHRLSSMEVEKRVGENITLRTYYSFDSLTTDDSKISWEALKTPMAFETAMAIADQATFCNITTLVRAIHALQNHILRQPMRDVPPMPAAVTDDLPVYDDTPSAIPVEGLTTRQRVERLEKLFFDLERYVKGGDAYTRG